MEANTRNRAGFTKLVTLIVSLLLVTTCFARESERTAVTTSTVTTATTAEFKDCDPENIAACFADRKKANWPFRILHKGKKKTKHVALLLHGLSDSPYFYRDIAPILFRSGMNVVAPRWSGHGTNFSDLAEVTYENWLSDLMNSRSMALEYGEKIVVAGMSMGGLGATFLLLKRPDVVAGGILFSPALKTYSYWGQEFTPCAVTQLSDRVHNNVIELLDWAIPTEFYSGEKPYGRGVRYKKISAAGACELYKARRRLNEPQEWDETPNPRFKRAGVTYHGGYPRNIWYLPNGERALEGDERIRKANFQGIKMPVFTVLSAYDMAVDVGVVLEMARNVQNQEKSELFFLSDGEEYELPRRSTVLNIGEVKHASVMLDPDHQPAFTTELNPVFNQMAAKIESWIQENFPAE